MFCMVGKERDHLLDHEPRDSQVCFVSFVFVPLRSHSLDEPVVSRQNSFQGSGGMYIQDHESFRVRGSVFHGREEGGEERGGEGGEGIEESKRRRRRRRILVLVSMVLHGLVEGRVQVAHHVQEPGVAGGLRLTQQSFGEGEQELDAISLEKLLAAVHVFHQLGEAG